MFCVLLVFVLCRILGGLGEKYGGFDSESVGAEFLCELMQTAAGSNHVVYNYDFFADDLRRYYYV